MSIASKIEVTDNYKKLVKIIPELSLARDMESVMRIVRTVARELTGSDGATFVLRKGDNCYYADENAIAPLWKGKEFPMTECVSGWVMKSGQPVLIEDVFKDERIPAKLYATTFVKSMLMVPIRRIDPIGAIGTYWGKNHSPGNEELDLLQSLADITAVTIETIKLHDELESRVTERTQQLRVLNQELESFSYSVSHDLRAPLRGINGFMSILLEDHGEQLGEEGRKTADRILQNASHMTSLIEDLLTFFKTGQRELVKTRLPMKLLVNEICDDLRAADKRRYVSVSIKDLPEDFGDSVLIKQVWQNLIENAFKYSGKKQKAFIEIGFEIKEGETIYFVKDNGAGFDMTYYHKLFGVFQRLHSQREFDGTGIGLAIVEKIIARHGGSIWAESVPEEGSVFYFSLGANPGLK